MKTHTRAVVIGGGVVGVSVLYHLAKLGWSDVVLVESNALGYALETVEERETGRTKREAKGGTREAGSGKREAKAAKKSARKAAKAEAKAARPKAKTARKTSAKKSGAKKKRK